MKKEMMKLSQVEQLAQVVVQGGRMVGFRLDILAFFALFIVELIS
jgi:hypothetical protein